ncbi:L7Ae/L30e/S12e/Gadd45 family ribosomal protein [Alkalibacillus aidingensis]|uniref:L7Ae/L30e/S12e/Gadd45 family ribosomal protein n=1 Tax=Alkalibacillus aidingensis TaxID=2747607 RepID=UPI0016609137|nr:ribosomal L7Ae/L30e/S12e/Gadd45 family protein [Alkalibacillus aidingensis]
MDNKYLNLLGLAFRARKITLGEPAIIEDIRSKQAKLILIANDASSNTKKKLIDKSRSYHVPYFIVDDRQTISQAIGQEGRVAVAIKDVGFAEKLKQLLSD